MNALRTILLLLVALCGVAPLAPAQERRLDDARARWEQMTPEEKARLRERFERFRQLDPKVREELEGRARFLRESQRRTEERLGPEERAKLSDLDPQGRREFFHERCLHEGRERGEWIRDALPKEWRERLEQATPEQRARLFGEMRQRMHERAAQAALERLGERLGLAQGEVARLQALPESERMHRVLELRQKLALREAEKNGPPPFATREQWQELSQLSPEEFSERFERARREHDFAGGERPAPEKVPQLRQLMEALRPEPGDFQRLEGLAPEERRARFGTLVRERALRVLREGELLPPEKIAELEKLPPELFGSTLRRMLPPPSGGPGRHERLGERGERPERGERHGRPPPR